MTTLFLGRYAFGQTKASDDIKEVKWFDVSDLSNPEFIKRNIMPEHQNMMANLIQKVYEDKLVPNIGEFHKNVQGQIDPDIVQPSEYKLNLT